MFRATTALLAGALVLAASAVWPPPAGARGEGGHTVVRSANGPAAHLSGPVTTGHLIDPAAPAAGNLGPYGYVEQEFFASGTASSFAPDGALGTDGKWSVRAASSAPYETRIVVRRPSDPSKFNGTVLVEWFNVSGGIEAAPELSYLGTEILRSGYAYVGVSAQSLGINGGAGILGLQGVSAGGGLRADEPARYGSLSHPGDEYSYDIYAQVGQALRHPGRVPVLGDLHPKRIIAVGESQSAFYLTTFANAVQPSLRTYDAFFIHSRGGTPAPLGPGTIVSGGGPPLGTRIRDDLNVPVFVLETETDVGPIIDYSRARQPDTSRFRLWEVAGTAHVDAYLVGSLASSLGCRGMVNEGPLHFVAVAALDSLDRWVSAGSAPPEAGQIKLASTHPPAVARDSLGNAVGGVRTPAVDVPVSTLSGAPRPGASPLCSLFGQTSPFDATTLIRLYHDKQDYLRAFQRSLDRAIRAGFLLQSDRAELMQVAREVQIP